MDIKQAEQIVAEAKKVQEDHETELEGIRAEIDRLTARRDKLIWEKGNALTREVEALKYIVSVQREKA